MLFPQLGETAHLDSTILSFVIYLSLMMHRNWFNPAEPCLLLPMVAFLTSTCCLFPFHQGELISQNTALFPYRVQHFEQRLSSIGCSDRETPRQMSVESLCCDREACVACFPIILSISSVLYILLASLYEYNSLSSESSGACCVALALHLKCRYPRELGLVSV